jgi:hypothetical protein
MTSREVHGGSPTAFRPSTYTSDLRGRGSPTGGDFPDHPDHPGDFGIMRRLSCSTGELPEKQRNLTRATRGDGVAAGSGRCVLAGTPTDRIDINGDNWASSGEALSGTFNEMFTLNRATDIETVELMASRVDDFGGPEAFNHYAVGSAHAMDNPYQWTKQVASHWAGPASGPEGRDPTVYGELKGWTRRRVPGLQLVLRAAGAPGEGVDAIERMSRTTGALGKRATGLLRDFATPGGDLSRAADGRRRTPQGDSDPVDPGHHRLLRSPHGRVDLKTAARLDAIAATARGPRPSRS